MLLTNHSGKSAAIYLMKKLADSKMETTKLAKQSRQANLECKKVCILNMMTIIDEFAELDTESDTPTTEQWTYVQWNRLYDMKQEVSMELRKLELEDNTI